jgi:hypothetical protein
LMNACAPAPRVNEYVPGTPMSGLLPRSACQFSRMFPGLNVGAYAAE